MKVEFQPLANAQVGLGIHPKTARTYIADRGLDQTSANLQLDVCAVRNSLATTVFMNRIQLAPA